MEQEKGGGHRLGRLLRCRRSVGAVGRRRARFMGIPAARRSLIGYFSTAYILMPFCGLIVTLFAGYAWKRAGEAAGLTGFWYRVWMFLLRVVAPAMIVLVFLVFHGCHFGVGCR